MNSFLLVLRWREVCNSQLGLYQTFITPTLLTPAQIKPKSFELRRNSLFLPRVDVPHVYVHAWTLHYLHNLVSTQTIQKVLTALAGSCTEMKSAPSAA